MTDHEDPEDSRDPSEDDEATTDQAPSIVEQEKRRRQAGARRIGAMIRRERKRRNMSQEQCAEEAFGVHQTVLSKWENPDRPEKPGPEMELAVARFLGISVNDVRAEIYGVGPRLATAELHARIVALEADREADRKELDGIRSLIVNLTSEVRGLTRLRGFVQEYVPDDPTD